MKLREYNSDCHTKCNFGDKRLTDRSLYIQDHLRVKYGQPLSKVFKNASDLKRTYEFLANSKTSFQLVTEPDIYQTANKVKDFPMILSYFSRDLWFAGDIREPIQLLFLGFFHFISQVHESRFQCLDSPG